MWNLRVNRAADQGKRKVLKYIFSEYQKYTRYIIQRRISFTEQISARNDQIE